MIIKKYFHQFLRLLLGLPRTGSGLLPELPVVSEQHIQTARHFVSPTPPPVSPRLNWIAGPGLRGERERLRDRVRKMKDCLIFLVDYQTGGAVHPILKCISRHRPELSMYLHGCSCCSLYAFFLSKWRLISQNKPQPQVLGGWWSSRIAMFYSTASSLIWECEIFAFASPITSSPSSHSSSCKQLTPYFQ